MTKFVVAALALSAAALAVSPALAQTVPAEVKFTTIADMPTLKDNTKQDHFTVGLTDGQISTGAVIETID